MAGDGAERELEPRLAAVAQRLTNLFGEGKTASVWIGSGLSMGCGYPSWRATVQKLCEACLPEKVDIAPRSEPTALLDYAQRCKEVSSDRYIATLGELFGRLPYAIRTAYMDICACPFTHLFTTNYDPCLEKASLGDRTLLAHPSLLLCLSGPQRTVAYLHGKARWGSRVDASRLLLTSEDLDQAYRETALLPAMLVQVLAQSPVVFVGYGLGEPVLVRFFARLRGLQEQNLQLRRYSKLMLLPEEGQDIEKEQASRMSELGIEILRYPLYRESDPTRGYDEHHWLDAIWSQVRDDLERTHDSLSEPCEITI